MCLVHLPTWLCLILPTRPIMVMLTLPGLQIQLPELDMAMIPVFSLLVPRVVQTVMPLVLETMMAPFPKELPCSMCRVLRAQQYMLQLAVLAWVRELLNLRFPLARMLEHLLWTCPHRLNRQLTLWLLMPTLLVGMLANRLTRWYSLATKVR